MENYDKDYIDDLTDRVFLIKSLIESNKLSIAPHLIKQVYASLGKIKLTAERKVEPETVDAIIRSMGGALRHFTEREEIKKKHAVIELQEAYYRILFDNFGDYYHAMMKANRKPYEIAGFLSGKDEFVNQIISVFDELYQYLLDFWNVAAEVGVIHLQDSNNLKATFAGDLFPAHHENAVSMAGLYVDTIVLPCPILRMARLKKAGNDKEFCRLLVKHVMNCMTYRDVALEDINPPILMILPDSRDLETSKLDEVMNNSSHFSLIHANYLFGKDFKELGEFHEFCRSLNNIPAVIKNLKRPERLIFDEKWGRNAEVQLKTLLEDKERMTISLFGEHPGLEVYTSCIGRFTQAYSAKNNAMELGGTPLINAKTSWLYYTWLLEYESMNFNIDTTSKKDFHMVHALSAGEEEGMMWLGNIPMENIIKLRHRGLLNEVREVLSVGVDELIMAKQDNYQATTFQVVDNIDKALIRHQRMLKKIQSRKLDFLGVDLSSFIANGTLAIASAYTGSPLLSALGVGVSIIGLPNLSEISSKYKEQQERIDKYKSSATGILFSHLK